MKGSKTLVIAFDGLDKELIEKFGLNHVIQEEYGTIDNNTNTSSVKTSELFANFITGETYEEHGIEGLQGTRYKDKRKDKILRTLVSNDLTSKRGFYAIRDILSSLIRAKEDKDRYSKEDLETDTLFENIENSRAMFVPAYNPGFMWRLNIEVEPLRNGYSVDRQARYWDRRAYEVRKKYLFEELENDILSPRDFLMCHFFRPDQYQHYYGDSKIGTFDENKLKKMYLEIDELAEKIKLKALENGYENIIFMSDHGLPTATEHNERVFYSSNRPLFESEVPKIKDFHDKIKELVGKTNP